MEYPGEASSPDRNPIHLAHLTRWPAVGAVLVAVAVASTAPAAAAAPAPVPETVVEDEAPLTEPVFEAGPRVESTTGAAPGAVVRPVARPGLPQATRADGIPYRIDAFELSYAQDHPEHPPIAEIMDLEILLADVGGGYVAPREGLPVKRIRLADVSLAGPAFYYGSAIRAIDERILEEFMRRGLAALLVLPDEADIDLRSNRDLRPPGRTALGIVIWTGRVLESRTLASGGRIGDDARLDNPKHERVTKYSPVQPGDLLEKKALDDYLARLNRHPGRNVSIALSGAGETGGLHLDYLIAEENKPITAYFQASNAGTEGTPDWRQRFGFAHTQLTGRDDILRLDYITGNFNESVNAVFGSYDFPIIGIDRLRSNIGGSWSQYRSTQLGFVTSRFAGAQWDVNSEFAANVFQYREFFTDLVAGIRYQDVSIDNQIVPGFPLSADSSYFFSSVGLRFERRTDTFQLRGVLLNDFSVSGVTGVSSRDMADMGAVLPPAVYDPNFMILRWEVFGSGYLESLLNPSAYRDPTSRWANQAHEFYLGFRGQYAYDDRLIPQHQMVAGGYYTVRGYPQSSIAGDNVYFWRAEYRLHVPRLFPIQAVPKRVPLIGDFKVARNQPYGRPDWDFIIRGFFDGARVTLNNKQAGENDETLLSPGVGGVLRFKDNLVFSIDWGYALKTIRNGLVKKGASETWLVITVIY